jgi:alkylation response protein AidB-like acyl-CoA dehydrogenase
MLDQGIPCTRETAIARVTTDNVYKRIVVSGVKIHGGIGFTLEHDVGLHFLNAVDNELAYSHSNYYRRLLNGELDRTP